MREGGAREVGPAPRIGAALLRAAVGRPPANADWAELLSAAVEERLADLIWRQCAKIIRGEASSRCVAEWRGVVVAGDELHRRQLSTLRGCVAGLESAGVEPTVLKGVPLSLLAYGVADGRRSTDIDIQVAPERRGRCAELLKASGWQRTQGGAPWHESWVRMCDGAPEYLEVHSLLVNDHLAHLPFSPREREQCVIGDLSVRVLPRVALPAYLAAHLATHQVPPLLWDLDFAMVRRALDDRELEAAASLAREAGLHRYLSWANRRADAIERMLRGDDSHAARVGIDRTGHTGVHSVWRHAWLAPSPASAARAVAASVWPRVLRGSPRAWWRSTALRARVRWRDVLRPRRITGPAAALPVRRLGLEGPQGVSFLRGVLDAGGELWVRVEGVSMRPTIDDGDEVLLRRVDGRAAVRDVALVDTGRGLVLHRVVKRSAGFVTTRGDACRVCEPAVSDSSVVAVAVAARRRGSVRAIALTSRFGARALLPFAAASLRRRLASFARQRAPAPRQENAVSVALSARIAERPTRADSHVACR